ncbi:MAG: hypothetical protein ABIO16_17485 [Nocardioides sp.]
MTGLLAIVASESAKVLPGIPAAVPMAVPLALVAGAHAATWGAYKDAPYEGFHPLRQVRTLLLACLAAITAVMTGLVDPHGLVPAVGVVYTLERLATEWWKTIVRVDDQSAYTIPMRLGFRGHPIDVTWIRYAVGVLVLAGMAGLGVGVHLAQIVAAHSGTGLPWWLLVVTVGGLGGWATAVGGAWKDAPVEGFSFWKFLRSPFVAMAWAVPLSLMTSDWLTLCLAAGGLAVFSIETYKTFWTGGHPPGKFANQRRVFELVGVRRTLGRVHAGTWVSLALASLWEALATTSGPRSISGRWGPDGALTGVVSATFVAVAAVVAAIFVLRSSAWLTSTSNGRQVIADPLPVDPASRVHAAR